jgi:predicted unusual protein kinase regulating ubiquinone biosynthesis (AarF/ABC1/UbiB family)
MTENSSFNNLLYVIYIIIKNSTNYLWNRDDMRFIKDLTYDIEKMNIVYVKILQAICINSFIFNSRQIDYLIKYTDQVPYTASDVNLDFIEQFKADDLLVTNTNPINSGIIALVYEGYYKEEKVAIKVIKNNIAFKVRNAMNDVDFICWIFSYIPFLKSFKLDQLYKNNRDIILNQVDFNLELENLLDYKKISKNIDYLYSPDVYEKFTKENPNILVMEYVSGIKYKDVKEEDKMDFVNILTKIGFATSLFHRINHADLHAGNIFFVNEEPKKIVFIDFGIVCRLTKEEQNSVYDFFKEVFVNKNYYEAAKKATINLIEPKNIIDNLSEEQKYKIYIAMANIIKYYWVENISIEFLPKINIMLDKYNLQMSQGFSRIQLSLASSIGLGTELAGGDLNNQKKIMEENIKELYSMPELDIPE